MAPAALRLHTQCSVKGGDVDPDREAPVLSDPVNKNRATLGLYCCVPEIPCILLIFAGVVTTKFTKDTKKGQLTVFVL